jgi:hypothetical protein
MFLEISLVIYLYLLCLILMLDSLSPKPPATLRS